MSAVPEGRNRHEYVDAQDLVSGDDSLRSDPGPGMIPGTISPRAREVAERNAREDRALLARLVREGVAVRRDGDYERRRPEVARPFVREVEELVRPKVNLAIRPKSKRRRR